MAPYKIIPLFCSDLFNIALYLSYLFSLFFRGTFVPPPHTHYGRSWRQYFSSYLHTLLILLPPETAFKQYRFMVATSQEISRKKSPPGTTWTYADLELFRFVMGVQIHNVVASSCTVEL
jgi:hypothetical protein